MMFQKTRLKKAESYSWHGYSPMKLPQLNFDHSQTEEDQKPQSEEAQKQARNPPEN